LNTYCLTIGKINPLKYYVLSISEKIYELNGLRRKELHNRVCPWWLGYLLVSPLRRFLYNPEEILRPYIKEGMNVLDVGCGMGFFSLPIARMIGETGRVVCVDLQERMIKGLIKRAKKAGLADRIDARTCRQNSLEVNDISGKIDFALAFALVHEVPDKESLFSEIYDTLKQDGKLLIVEPKGHVSKKDFGKTISIAEGVGLEALSSITESHIGKAVVWGLHDLKIRRSYGILFRKRQENK
jgi:2-polyprenyl-3-methyl-5-hydroxy-6-metoxy-1,4-benzoquinol methylase